MDPSNSNVLSLSVQQSLSAKRCARCVEIKTNETWTSSLRSSESSEDEMHTKQRFNQRGGRTHSVTHISDFLGKPGAHKTAKASQVWLFKSYNFVWNFPWITNKGCKIWMTQILHGVYLFVALISTLAGSLFKSHKSSFFCLIHHYVAAKHGLDLVRPCWEKRVVRKLVSN